MDSPEKTIGLFKTIKHYNTDEWGQSALHFKEFSKYTNYPPNSHPASRYFKFWEEEARRCVYGFDIGRDRIPGYFYFYLNYTPIEIVVSEKEIDFNIDGNLLKREKAERPKGFPDFWDGDYNYFHYLDEAEESGQHAVVIKTRSRGFSWKGGSMCDRNYYLIPGSKSFCFADDKEYLIEDGILTKAWDIMDHIETYTPWGKRRHRHDSIMHKRSSYYLERGGLKIERGFKSEIMGISTKNNPNKIRGKRGKLIINEESGKDPHLLVKWNIGLKSMQFGNKTFGLMLSFGTGGTESSDFMGLEQLYYEGSGYNVYLIPNRWDENAGNTKCGYFSSVLMNYPGTMDRDGNSDMKLAEKIVDAGRDEVRKGTKNPQAIIRHIAEEPKNPSEACMRIGGTIFPINDLKQQLEELRAYPEKYEETEYIGSFTIDTETEKVKWTPDPTAKPIRMYPASDKKAEIEGCWVIWEHPVANSDGEIPYGIYIAGNDTYDHDESTTESLASTFIMNRITERIVAEYTGRPVTAKMYYEHLRRGLIYYNARCNYENNWKGLMSYFEFRNSAYLLCDTPKIVYDKIYDKSVLNRGKGTPGTLPVNKWALELILIWLLNPITPGSEILNLHTIRSIPLLQELIYYWEEGNYDRVKALGMLMILKEDLAKWIPDEQPRKVTVSPFFARMPMFQEKMKSITDPFEKLNRIRELKKQ